MSSPGHEKKGEHAGFRWRRAPENRGGESFSYWMLRLESKRKVKGSHSPVGIFICSLVSSTVVTGRRQIESVMLFCPLITIWVTCSRLRSMPLASQRGERERGWFRKPGGEGRENEGR